MRVVVKPKLWVVGVVLSGLIGLGMGCDRGSSQDNSSTSARPTTRLTGDGIVRGRVVFEGTPPEMRTIANQPCHDGSTPLKEQTVLVDQNGGLQNTVVYLEGGPEIGGSPPSQSALLDQINCQYVPHVLLVQAGQPVRIRSSDPTLHNVHYDPQKNPPANFGMTGAGQEKTVTFKSAEWIHVRCDVHPWMSAWIAVVKTPLATLSAADGTFQIERIPPGQYKLVSWHERLGRQEQPVTIEEGKPVELKVTYAGS